MNKGISILLVIAAAGSFWAAGTRHAPLLKAREHYRLDQAAPLENTPPLLAFTTVALGGFRGILADLLWMRVIRLQDEGKFFEIVQLSDWITKLEPRFAQIWAYHAWNMSYNISVLLNDPADRWRWVRHGIGLLRDEGLKYNAGSPLIYRELGWLFQHKIGANLDQAHLYYKKAWADEMTDLLGGARPDYVHLTPEKADQLRRVYKMDPAFMQGMEKEFGELDWRLPMAHALYWALQGRRYASGFDAVNLDRMVFQSMADNFRSGRLITDSQRSYFAFTPNLAAIPWVLQSYEAAMAEHPQEQTVKSAHQYFLREAIVTLYTYQQIGRARELFDDFKKRYDLPEAREGFEAFVYKAYMDHARDNSQSEAMALVESACYQSLFWGALNETERSAGYAKLAQLTHDQYMAERKNPEFRERTGLPPLEQMFEEARKRLRTDLPPPEIPPVRR